MYSMAEEPAPVGAALSRHGCWLSNQAERGFAVEGRWYAPRALGERGKSAAAKVGGGVLAVALAIGLGACGGGERQDVNEPSGKFPVKVTQASFPTRQRISDRTDLVLGVENAGKDTIPD